MSYLGSVVSKGFEFIKGGKLADCFDHVFDMANVYINYGKDNELKVQDKLLKSILKNAYTNCEYYREISKTLKNKDDINEYPLIDKLGIINNFDKLISDNKDKMIYNVASTGGSTGQPLKFLNSNGIDDYYQLQLWKRFGYIDGDVILNMTGEKIADEDLKNNIYWKTRVNQDSSYGKYLLSSLYLNDNNINIYYEFIKNLKPSFIRGYPSSVYEMADYIIKNNLKGTIKLKGVELTSETSYDWQWEKIKEAFDCKVFLQYGHTESCVFAYSYDESMKLRVEPIYGYVEILDEQGNKVKPGEVGEVVCTTLHNKVMPFIRYKTGDLAEFGGYDGKYMILNRVIGRIKNYLVNSDGKSVNLNPFISEHQVKAFEKIIKYQFEQFEKGKVILKIVKTEEYTDDDEDDLYNLFAIAHIELSFEYVDDIEKTERGKHKVLIQHIKNTN